MEKKRPYNLENMYYDEVIMFLEKKEIPYNIMSTDVWDIIIINDIEYLFGSDDGGYVRCQTARSKK